MAQNGTETAPQGMLAYKAPSLFQPHRLREAIRDAHEKKITPLQSIFYAIPSLPIARFLAPLGFDVAIVDWEHSSLNVETMTDIVHSIQFMSEGKTAAMVRVPGHDHAAIGYALDAGASIMVPQVETVEEAQHVVSAAKFGTNQRGTRSAPPFRLMPFVTDIAFDGSGDIHKALNKQAAIVIQIETLAGIHNLDDILTQVKDIDAVWLGGLDARISMNLRGNLGMGGDEPEWLEASNKFFETLKKHDKPYAGFSFGAPPFGSPEKFKKAAETMSLMVTSADVAALLSIGPGLQADRETLAEAFAESNGAKNGTKNGEA